jgi:hypothetical protein
MKLRKGNADLRLKYASARYRLSPRGHWRSAEEVLDCQPPALRRAVIRYLHSDSRLIQIKTK